MIPQIDCRCGSRLALPAKSPFLDSATFWFLDVVVELATSISPLTSPNLALLFNRKTHGLSMEQVEAKLHELRDARLVEIFDRNDSPATAAEIAAALRWDGARKDAAMLDSSAILEGESRTPQILYRLTPLGGAAWEAITKPDWSRFIDGPWMDPIAGLIDCASADRGRAEQALLLEARQLDVHWTVCEPWQATYWKQLPRGHCASGTYTPIHPALPRFLGELERKQFWTERKQFRRWLRSDDASR